MREPDTKCLIVCDSIVRKHPEQVNPQRQEVEWWVPGDGVMNVLELETVVA